MSRYNPSRSRGACLATALLAALAITVSTPGVAPALATVGAVRTVPNVRVSHDDYSTHVEPALAVNPRDPHNLLGASQVIGHGTNVLATYASFDGGRTWRDNGPLALPRGTTFADDVTVAFDPRGVGFVCAMARTPQGRRGVYVWRSDDGGRTFHRPVTVVQGTFADHPGLAVDPTRGPTGGILYVTWATDGGLGFSRSVDEGRHFASPRIIMPGDVSIPVIAAGPGGIVSVAYYAAIVPQADAPGEPDAQSAGMPPTAGRADGAPGPGGGLLSGLNARIAVISSADGGRTFRRPTTVGGLAGALLAPTSQVRLPSQPGLAIDPRDDTVYLAYVAAPAGAGTRILLARSSSGGRAWTAPESVVGAGGGAVHFQPQIVVDASGGVDVTAFALVHGRVATILARSAPHGETFGPPAQITDRPFDPALARFGQGPNPKHGLWWLGDYQGLAVGPGVLYPCWNDTRSGRLEIFAAIIPIAPAR